MLGLFLLAATGALLTTLSLYRSVVREELATL
jgi:hypothetical protein